MSLAWTRLATTVILLLNIVYSPVLLFGQDAAPSLTSDPYAPGELSIERFSEPPMSVRPWVYYWNLKGNTSKELVTRDLENMAQIGVGGLLVFDSRRYWDDYDSKTHVPVPLDIRYEFMSQQWREIMTHLVREADRLGLKVSFNISDSGGQLRGPWDMGELGPYELIWTEGNLNGPKHVTFDLPAPSDRTFYSDVAIMAVRIVSQVDANREDVKLNHTWEQVKLDATPAAPVYDQIVDLTEKIHNGKLDWHVPEGHWKVLRFGQARIGEDGCVDILNSRAVEAYFHKMPGTLIKENGELVGRTLTDFYNVSWEGVHPNWNDTFAEFFQTKRGYNPISYLPILRGLAPNDGVDPGRFLADYMKTISDAFCANCYETVGRMCHERGVRWRSEDGGPWNRRSPLFQYADMLSFWGQNDTPQGEFWIRGYSETNAPYAAMAAHIYGKRDVSLEAFTHMNKHWSVYPGLLKPYADVNFLCGANFLIWHAYTASEPQLGKPGYEYFAGSHINSNVTWQSYVRPFMDYMARCQLLLRQGVYRADVCAYVSARNYVMWGLADKWNPTSDLELPLGYRYDLLDTKVLVERLEYRDNCLVLPGGAKYKLLVVDLMEDAVPVEVMRKLQKLAMEGAPILFGNKKPVRDFSLLNWKQVDQEIQEIALTLWESQDYPNLFSKCTVQDALNRLNVTPDFSTVSNASFLHRTDDDHDVYYLASYDPEVKQAENCSFRVTGKTPTLWNPLSGQVVSVNYHADDVDTTIDDTLPLPCFIVFSKIPTEFQADKPVDYLVLDDVPVEEAYTVFYDPEYGGPGLLHCDSTTTPEVYAQKLPGVKYYSGTATYRFKFNVQEKDLNKEVILALKDVHDIARARLNGKDCGVAWTEPFELNLTHAIKPGSNVLEVDVANTWRNRLIGDASLPPEERVAKTNVVLEKNTGAPMPTYRGYLDTDPLAPSGMTTPPRIFTRVQK
ncbi:MAG: glycosyl hydrolase [Planctomycetia bacterium]|nr:glycosyl hydrolase [Planctomycetia bacterium]